VPVDSGFACAKFWRTVDVEIWKKFDWL